MEIQIDFEKRYRLVTEIIETIVLTVLMFLVIRLAVQNFNIDGMSMEPGLHNQELILVDKWSYLFHPPARGDTIVFIAPPNPSQDYIKRIIGLPGDVISIENTTVSVNGQPLDEPYVQHLHQGNPYPSFTNRVVPEDAYFVLGDNRAGSSDSRDWGCVPKSNIIGRAALVYWPLGQNNDGTLPNYADVFRNVPPPTQPTSSICTINTTPRSNARIASPGTGDLPVVTLFILLMPSVFVGINHRKRPTNP